MPKKSIKEEWRAVVGYEGLYEVSSHGHIRRVGGWIRKGTVILSGIGRRLRGYLNHDGYLRVCLSDSMGRNVNRFVHILVVEAFVGPVPDGMEVNHKDGDKSNARTGNLEIVTPKGNGEHASMTGLRPVGSAVAGAKLNDAMVIKVRGWHRDGESMNGIAGRLGLSPGTVRDCVKRITWRHVK